MTTVCLRILHDAFTGNMCSRLSTVFPMMIGFD